MSKATERVGLSQHERWPTYLLDKPSKYNPAADVDVDTLARWRAAIDAFDKVQEEMADVYEVADERQRREAAIEKAEKEAAEAQARLEALRQS